MVRHFGAKVASIRGWQRYALLAMMLLPGLASVLVLVEPREDAAVAEAKTRLVRYSFTLSNQTDQSIDRVLFKTFAPMTATAYQQVNRIEASEAFETKTDELGNQELEFLIQDLPPFGQKVITVSAQLDMWDSPRAHASPDNPSSLSPLVAPDRAELQQALAAISGHEASGPDMAWMKAANTWVHQNLEDVGYVSEDRGALFALTERKGDCTEFMHALVALARAREIPSLAVAGFRVQGQNAILKAVDYHNWALFKADDAWRLADPHGNVFEEDQGNYVAFRLLREGQAGHRENSQRFFIHDPRVTVSMN